MKTTRSTPQWLLAVLVLLTGFYFSENPAIRFGTPAPDAPLTGQEQLANLLVAATVATLLFIAIRAFGRALDSRK